jgi:CheY-like chemotaxis protein
MSVFSRILIIDDDPRAREAIKALLGAEQEYQLELAGDGQQGLELAAETQPDLVLLDVMMPGLDGFEVCRQLRANKLLAEVPVVLVTALDDHDSRLRGLKAGADDFISKPYDRLELRARVASILRLNRYRRLLAERGKFEWLLEHTEEAYLLLQEDGSCGYANKRARDYLNLPRSGGDFLEQARRYYQLLPPLAWETWPYPNAALVPRCLVRAETEAQHGLWLEVESTQVEMPGELSFLLRLRDVSDKMLLAQRNWAFQQLLMHKLRTPMLVSEILRLIQERLAGQVDMAARNLLEMAVNSAQRQSKQLTQVLAYLQEPALSHPRHGEPLRLDGLPALLDELVQDLELTPPRCTIAPELSQRKIVLSAHGMQTLLRELLDNARKFHPRHVPAVEIAVLPGERQDCVLTCSDDGMCLPPEELEKVWLPYYQWEKFTTGEVPGMGLGLAMVASIVWNAGGKCRLFNRENGPGVSVELSLPLLDTPVSPARGK